VVENFFINKLAVIMGDIRVEDFNFGKICTHWASEKLVFRYLVAGVDLEQHWESQTSTAMVYTEAFRVKVLTVSATVLSIPDYEQEVRTRTFRAA
jgi:hypothetical protein